MDPNQARERAQALGAADALVAMRPIWRIQAVWARRHSLISIANTLEGIDSEAAEWIASLRAEARGEF